MATEQLNLRLDPEILAELERVAAEEALDRTTVARRLLQDALGRWRVDRALTDYQRGDASIGGAAADAGISVWDFLDLVKRRGIAYQLTPEELSGQLDVIETVNLPIKRGDQQRGNSEEIEWRGERVKTLRDIPCQPDHALLIGLAPAEPSIRAGHYYQGKLGKRIWRRLRDAGLLQELLPGREDESLERSGHGVTDLIKRPIKTSREVMSDEAEFASVELRSKVESWRPAVVIFVFKEVTRLLVDHVHPRPGRGPRYVDSKSFLLMGPYAPLRDVDRNVKELRHLLNEVGLV